MFAVLSCLSASLPPPPPSLLVLVLSLRVFGSLHRKQPPRRVDVDTRLSPVVTKCTENGGQAVYINAGLRALASYFTFIDFPFCSGRWCESSSVITVHISGGDSAVVKSAELEARSRARGLTARTRCSVSRATGEKNQVTDTIKREEEKK